MLTTIASFREPYEAHMLSGRLQSEGFFATVAHEYHVGNNWLQSTALGGCKVQVLSSQEQDASKIEELCRAGEYQAQLAAALGDLDDLHCPACGSQKLQKRCPAFEAALTGLLVFFAAFIAPWHRIITCANCGRTFKDRYGLIGKADSTALPIRTFSEATIADIPEIHRVRLSVQENILTDPLQVRPSDTERAMREGAKAWVCHIDGIIRGFSFADPRAQNLWALFIEPDFERLGIGRELHNLAVDWLFANGAKMIWLITEPGTRAEKFYHAAGWKLVDSEPNGDYRLELSPDVWSRRRNKF